MLFYIILLTSPELQSEKQYLNSEGVLEIQHSIYYKHLHGPTFMLVKFPKVLRMARHFGSWHLSPAYGQLCLAMEYSVIKEDQGGLSLRPCSSPLNRFLQDYVQALSGDSPLQVSFQKALRTRTHQVLLPPFPQSPSTIPAGFAPSNSPHVLVQCFQGI